MSATTVNRLMQKSIRAFCIRSQRKAWFSLTPKINKLELVDFAESSVTRDNRVLQGVLHHPVNAFPAFNCLSPRAWVLVAIVLLHAGFIWSLSNGLSRPILVFAEPRIVARFLPDEAKPLPPPLPPLDRKPRIEPAIPVEQIPVLGPLTEGPTAIHFDTTPQPAPVPVMEARPAPVIVQPQIDPALALSQPSYPPQDIRLGNAGTVLLAVLVLTDGTVGDVRVERSSGFPRLDASALSEARQWRFRPGMQDGVPLSMWKQLPIVFRLEE